MIDMQAFSPEEQRPRILVVDDEGPIRALIRRALEMAEDYEILEADSGRAAQGLLHRQPFDVVITDLQMPGMGGLSLMQWAQNAQIDTAWIILTGHGTFDDAVRAVQLGAFDFISKPLSVVDALVIAVRNALRQRRLSQQRDRLHQQIQRSNVRLRKQVQQLHQALRLLLAQAETIGEDLRRAELIQRAMLPAEPPDVDGYTVNAVYRPSRQVGGDLYDVTRLDERHVAFYVADAAGHGVSAAMLAVLFKHRLPVVQGQPPHPTPPAEVLAAVNDCLLSEFSRPGLFVTAAYCLLDTATGELTVASAGHPSLLLRRQDGAVERIAHTGPALGLDEHAQIGQQTYTLRHGDRLLLYTDGLYEAEGPGGPLIERTMPALLSRHDRGGQEVLMDLLTRSARQRGDRPQSDDITLLLLTAGPGQSTIDNGPGRGAEQAAEAELTDASAALGAEASAGAAQPAFAEASPAEPAFQSQAAGPAEPAVAPTHAQSGGRAAQPGEPAAESVGGGPEPPPGVGMGVSGQRCTISVRGRGTWTYCSALHDVGFSEVDAHHSLTLDLSRCDYLDSTFLGTVQEVVEHADREGVEVRIQGVRPPVREQFEELGMDRVLRHIAGERSPLPERIAPLTTSAAGGDQQRRRILYAHEALAALNDHNRQEFLRLIEGMRRELTRSREGA